MICTSHYSFLYIYSQIQCFFSRLIRNPLGSTHPEATLKAAIEHGAADDAIEAAQAEFHAHLAAARSQNNQQSNNHDLLEDSELIGEDRELDSDSQGEFSILISRTNCIRRASIFFNERVFLNCGDWFQGPSISVRQPFSCRQVSPCGAPFRLRPQRSISRLTKTMKNSRRSTHR